MENSIKDGIKYMLIASMLFAFMGAFAKTLSQNLNSVEIVFFRNVFGVALILFSIYKSPLNQIGGKMWLLIFRGIMGFSALLMFFYNITQIPLAQAMTFSQTSPIFTAIFAYIFVKERMSLVAWIGVFIGFIGILFITKFDGSNLDKTDWLGVLCGVGAALAYTSIRELRKFYDNRAIVLSFMSIGTIGPIVLMILAEFTQTSTYDFIIAPFVMPKPSDWILILALGLVSTYAQIFMTKAYSCTKAGIIGTIGYSNIIFSIILGTILGDTLPDILIIFGIMLIVFSGYLVSRK